MSDTTFKGSARRLDDTDLPRIGALIGVGEDEIHAFMEVESRGRGFDDSGRPIILYEPHVAYRNSSGSNRAALVRAGLAYPKWKPNSYGPSSAQYPKLVKAVAIDRTAALKACSWGLLQVLGENYRLAGFDNVEDMVEAAMDSEAAQLQMAVQFLVSAGLDDDVRAHRWQAVARGYNGAGYAANQYDKKLAAAFKKWQRIPDTPWAGASKTGKGGARFGLLETVVEPPVAVLNPVAFPEDALKPYEIEALQIRLRELGYYTVGSANKDYGGATRGGVIAFQTDHGIEPDGHYTDETRAALADNKNKRPIADARKNITEKQLKEQGSRTIAAAMKIKTTSAATTALTVGGTAVTALVQYGNDALGYLNTLRTNFDKIPWWVWPAIFLGLIWYYNKQGSKVVEARVDDERKFKNTADPSPKLVNQVIGQEETEE